MLNMNNVITTQLTERELRALLSVTQETIYTFSELLVKQ